MFTSEKSARVRILCASLLTSAKTGEACEVSDVIKNHRSVYNSTYLSAVLHSHIFVASASFGYVRKRLHIHMNTSGALLRSTGLQSTWTAADQRKNKAAAHY